uniref:uncharacterized protein LOC118545980 n=1 Tax=Halichoerus grypus TaxID=9711 RepID=UPI001659D69A|nr:uncharacterized protein LOC118545980 [Halichoerus grypus]
MSEGREQLIKFFFLMIQGSYNDCTSIQGSVARVDAGSQMRKIKLSGGLQFGLELHHWLSWGSSLWIADHRASQPPQSHEGSQPKKHLVSASPHPTVSLLVSLTSLYTSASVFLQPTALNRTWVSMWDFFMHNIGINTMLWTDVHCTEGCPPPTGPEGKESPQSAGAGHVGFKHVWLLPTPNLGAPPTSMYMLSCSASIHFLVC